MQTLELRIPPLGVVIIAGLCMRLTAAYFPKPGFHFPFQQAAAWAIGVSGLLVCVLAVTEFRRAKTTLNPIKPGSASSLVRTGIFSRTRNPIYLGMLLMLAGLAIATANTFALFFLPAFVIYMNHFQIGPEERALRTLFGQDFDAYCLETRRWI